MTDLYGIVYIFTLAGAIFSALVAWFAWPYRRDLTTIRTYSVLMALVSATCILYCILWTTPSDGVAWAAAHLRFTTQAIMPVVFLISVMQFDRGKWMLSPWHAAGIFAVPLIVIASVWSNEYHQLFAQSWRLLGIGMLRYDQVVHGPGWHLHTLYSYTMIGAALLIGLRGSLRQNEPHAVEYLLIVLTVLTIVIVNLPVGILLLNTWTTNLLAISLVAAGTVYGYALHRYRRSGFVPIALEYVYNTMRDPVLVLNADRRVVSANPAALHLFGPATSAVKGYQLEAACARLVESAEAVPGRDVEVTFQINGQPMTFDIQVQPITDAGSRPAVLVVMRDITQRIVAVRQSFELSLETEKVRLLERFISDTSHDLRTPLTIMQTAAYLAQRADDPAKRAARLEEIVSQIGRITRIIDTLHLMTRLDTLGAAAVSAVPLKQTVVPLTSELEDLIRARGHTLVTECSDATVRGDPELLRIALHHLIGNAALYTPPGGRIEIRCLPTDDHAVITVTDNGVGIAADNLRLVFERLAKGDAARSSLGAGLGLSIVRKVAELHGGTIDVFSTPGAGSTFTLKLPLYHSPAGAVSSGSRLM
ncbi:MAG: PAS domain-containing protein [Chloroflexi bacterium]|nr:PAS domain-containing protein [Chloroflexota bacterium]